MSTIGFLHTAPAHVDRFEALVAAAAPGTEVVSVVDEILLDRARSHGLTDLVLIGGIADRIAQFADVDAVVCTCSTIAGLAADIGEAAGVPVHRVDRAMAERAVDTGSRIAVVAGVDSTIEPTTALLESVAVERGVEVAIDVVTVGEAWIRFEHGDIDGYEAMVAAAVRACHGPADVVVLAQASMAAVADRPDLADIETPILSSPALAVARALGI